MSPAECWTQYTDSPGASIEYISIRGTLPRLEPVTLLNVSPLQPLSPGRDIVITPTQYAELRTLDSTHEHAADLPHHLNTKQQAVKVVIPSRHFVILFILILYFLVLLIFDILCNAFQIVVHKKFPIALRCIQTSIL